MPRPLVSSTLLLTALACPAACLGAQVRVGLRTGVVLTSKLVRDSIVQPITLRPNAALQVGASLETRLEEHYRIGASISVSRSDLVNRTSAGDTTVTTLTIWQPAVTVGRVFGGWLAAEARAGATIYDPERRVTTIFRDGAPIDPTLGASLSAQRPLGTAFTAALGVSYDVHRFTTPALEAVGFTGETLVHRVSFHVAIQRTLGRSP